MRRLKPRLSYANVVASMALFVALGGVSWAAVKLPKNSVKSAQIKNGQVKNKDIGSNAVTGSKVKNGSLGATDFKAGQLPAGPRGFQGFPGAKGDPGATNVVVRQSRDGSGSAGGIVQADVSCSAGEKLIGGGGGVVAAASASPAAYNLGNLVSPNAVVLNGPSTANGINEPADASVPTTWSFAAQVFGTGNRDAVVYAVCAKP